MNRIIRITSPYAIILLLLCLFSTKLSSQTLCLKTNALRDLSGTLNIGAEYPLSDKFSVEATINYNPWSFEDNKKEKQISFQPEIKYWFSNVFNGFFAGIECHYGVYNRCGYGFHILSTERFWGIDNSEYQNFRYQGPQYGAGAVVGYSWVMTRRLNLEASIAYGISEFKYSKYESRVGGEKLSSGREMLHGFSQVGLSFVYILF